MKIEGAVLINDSGEIVEHTLRSNEQSCIEYCKEIYPFFDMLLEMGAKIVPVEIKILSQ